MGSAGSVEMTATLPATCSLGELHRFEGGGSQFLYLVSAGAIFQMDEAVSTVFEALSTGPLNHAELAGKLVMRGMTANDAFETIDELFRARVLVGEDTVREPLD